MKVRHITVLLGAALLSGCATGYHSSNGLAGLFGGYSESEGPGELIKVEFTANGFSNAATVEQYLMLRCAEVAQARGKPHFRMYGSIAEAIMERQVRKQLVSMVTIGPYGYAYILLEDQGGPDTVSTADTLAKYAHLKEKKKS